MAYIVFILTYLNAALPQFGIVNDYLRIGQTVSIWDLSIFFGFIWAVMRGGSAQAEVPPDRAPPVLVVIYSLFIAAIICGSVGMLTDEGYWKIKLDSLREWVILPVLIFTGYRLTGGERSIRWLVKAMCVACVLGSISQTALQVSGGGEATDAKALFRTLRSALVQFNPEYASIGALLMIYMLVTKRRVYPRWMLLAGAICGLGATMFTFSRTSAVIVVIGAAALFACLPREQRLKNIAITAIVVPCLGVFFFLLLLGSGKIFGNRFADVVLEHYGTLLPAERESRKDVRAWDSRLSGITTELKMWTESPFIGIGFGSNFNRGLLGKVEFTAAFNHNTWTSALSQAGIVGLAALIYMFAAGARVSWKVLKTSQNPTFVLMGVLGWLTAIVFIVRCTCTASMGWRLSMMYAVVFGAVIRTREVQRLTNDGLFSDPAPAYDDEELVLINPDTGRAVPLDFGQPASVHASSHFN